jgi:hypothetical protein
VGSGFIQAAVAGVVMALALWGWLELSADLANWFVAAGGVVTGGIVYALVLLALRVVEIRLLVNLIQKKVFRR